VDAADGVSKWQNTEIISNRPILNGWGIWVFPYGSELTVAEVAAFATRLKNREQPTYYNQMTAAEYVGNIEHFWDFNEANDGSVAVQRSGRKSAVACYSIFDDDVCSRNNEQEAQHVDRIWVSAIRNQSDDGLHARHVW